MWDQTASLDKVYKVNKHNYQAATHVDAVNQIAEENVMINQTKDDDRVRSCYIVRRNRARSGRGLEQ